jgi:hypothetical protein
MLALTLKSGEVTIPLIEVSDRKFYIQNRSDFTTLLNAISRWLAENHQLTDLEYKEIIEVKLLTKLLDMYEGKLELSEVASVTSDKETFTVSNLGSLMEYQIKHPNFLKSKIIKSQLAKAKSKNDKFELDLKKNVMQDGHTGEAIGNPFFFNSNRNQQQADLDMTNKTDDVRQNFYTHRQEVDAKSEIAFGSKSPDANNISDIKSDLPSGSQVILGNGKQNTEKLRLKIDQHVNGPAFDPNVASGNHVAIGDLGMHEGAPTFRTGSRDELN